MWKEMVFEPEVKKHGEASNAQFGEITKAAKDLMLEFLHKNWVKSFRIGNVYKFNDGIMYRGDTTCYQIFYYDSSIYRPSREI